MLRHDWYRRKFIKRKGHRRKHLCYGFKRDPMKQLLKRQSNKRVRQQSIGEEKYSNGSGYRKALDLWWVLY